MKTVWEAAQGRRGNTDAGPSLSVLQMWESTYKFFLHRHAVLGLFPAINVQ